MSIVLAPVEMQVTTNPLGYFSSNSFNPIAHKIAVKAVNNIDNTWDYASKE